MTQSPFIMTSQPLPGKVSAAILFTELGSAVTAPMLQYFSRTELKRLRQAIQALPPYDVGDALQVLQRAASFGKSRGIYAELPQEEPLPEAEPLSDFRARVGGSPEAVAQVLGSWLQDE